MHLFPPPVFPLPTLLKSFALWRSQLFSSSSPCQLITKRNRSTAATTPPQHIRPFLAPPWAYKKCVYSEQHRSYFRSRPIVGSEYLEVVCYKSRRTVVPILGLAGLFADSPPRSSSLIYLDRVCYAVSIRHVRCTAPSERRLGSRMIASMISHGAAVSRVLTLNTGWSVCGRC